MFECFRDPPYILRNPSFARVDAVVARTRHLAVVAYTFRCHLYISPSLIYRVVARIPYCYLFTLSLLIYFVITYLLLSIALIRKHCFRTTTNVSNDEVGGTEDASLCTTYA
jgi:hypothetical protein